MFGNYFKKGLILCSFFSIGLMVSSSWADWVDPWSSNDVTASSDYARSGFKDKFNELVEHEQYQDAFNDIYSNSSNIGNRSYDVLLGNTALKADRPDEAAVACERILINNPF